MSFKVLLVEDDPAILAVNKAALEGEGYQIALAETLSEAHRQLADFEPDLMVLDIMLPDGSGIDFCEQVRAESSVRVIFLSMLDSTEHIVDGLLIGADDYLTKPYQPEELCARVKVQLRRLASARERQTTDHFGELTLDFANQSASYQQTRLNLKPKEFLLLAALIRDSEQYLSGQELYETVWDRETNNDLRTVLVHISKIRSKLKECTVDKIYIERDTVQGYRIRKTEER